MKKQRSTSTPTPPLPTEACSCHPLKRVNYFTGQLLTADDLIAEQNYHLEKHRQHNRLCHGYGVIEGLNVSVAKENGKSTVIVGPGAAIDSAGNLIQLCDPARLTLPESGTPLFVAIRFAECPTDPVPTLGEPSSGLGNSEQYARIQEQCEVFLSPTAGPDLENRNCHKGPRLPPGLVLSRLTRSGGRWHLDKKFRPARAH